MDGERFEDQIGDAALLWVAALLVMVAFSWSLASLMSDPAWLDTWLFLSGLVVSFVGFGFLLWAVQRRWGVVDSILAKHVPSLERLAAAGSGGERPGHDGAQARSLEEELMEANDDLDVLRNAGARRATARLGEAIAAVQVPTTNPFDGPKRKRGQGIRGKVKSCFLVGIPLVAASSDLAGQIAHFIHSSGVFF